jgi:hypothetical protein
VYREGNVTYQSIDVDPGTGQSKQPVAVDIVAGTDIQVVKADIGGSGQSIPLTAGQKSAANSVPVVLASDQTPISVADGGGSMSVDDGGGSLTVDGTVTANIGTSNGLALDATLTNGSQKTKIVDSGGANVAAVSAAGALKVDNSAVTQPVSGTVTANAGTGTFTVSGAVTNAGTFAVQDSQAVADNAGFTDGTTKVFVSGYILDETAGAALTENDAAASRINSNRAQVMVIEDDATRGRRVTVTAANALKVDGSAVTQPVSLAGNQAVNIAQLGGNTVSAGNGASGTGVLRVTVASDSTGQIGQVPLTSGGLSISRKLSAASTNATNVKASAGQVYAVHCMNTNAALRYLKLYDKASAPTVGTDTPVITVPLPTNAPVVIQPACGIAFANGIGFAMTTGIADSDATAVAANEIVLNLLYK